MTTVYLVRHGETDGNKQDRFQGSSDIPMNDTGRDQGRKVGQALKDVWIDAVYTSPLQRAYDTATFIAAPHGLVPIPDAGLMEINGGLLEGQRFDRLQADFPGCMDNMFSHPARVVCPEGETMRQVYDRATQAINRIVAENQGKTIAIASHGCTISAYLHYTSGKPFEEMPRYIVVNAAINKIVYDQALCPHLLYSNEHGHLATGDFIDTSDPVRRKY